MACPIGAVAGLYGADQIAAGWDQIGTRQPPTTYFVQALQNTGLDDKGVFFFDFTAGLGLGLGSAALSTPGKVVGTVGDTAGLAANRGTTVKPGGTVELFTDARGAQISGSVGVGPKDASAVAADARNMANIPSNSQATVIANNPYIPKQNGGTGAMMDFLPEAARITESGGVIVVNANNANPYFRSIPSQAQLDALGLRIEYQGSLLPQYQNMNFLRTDGSPLPGPMQTIIFIKK
ncbi:hypothetical protein FACS189488_14590 [Betaproteobacteria bacterium]|nr:hypothetical protein FACS189488_14590 [Betaproteobacteria bacterium]